MKLLAGINKWRVADDEGNLFDEVFGNQADAEAFGGRKVVDGVTSEATIFAAASKMILPPVEAIRIEV